MVTAYSDEEHLLKSPENYLPCAFTLALLFQKWPLIRVIVATSAGDRYQLEMPTIEATIFNSLPTVAKSFGVLKVQYATSVEPTDLTPAERYTQVWIKGVTILLMKEVSTLTPLRQQLPVTSDQYLAALDQLLALLNVLRDLHRSIDAPQAATTKRHLLSNGIQLLRKGLKAHRAHIRKGTWEEVQKDSVVLGDAADIIVSLSQ